MFVFQRLQSEFTIDDDVRIVTTPRKLTLSLQDVDDCDMGSFEKQNQKIRSSTSFEAEGSPIGELNGVDVFQNLSYEVEAKRENEAGQKNNVRDDDLALDDFKLVSSIGDASADGSCKVPFEVDRKERNAIEGVNQKMRNFRKATLSLVCALAVLVPAVILSAFWFDSDQECFNLVPT